MLGEMRYTGRIDLQNRAENVVKEIKKAVLETLNDMAIHYFRDLATHISYN
jgi:porphobilinogen deaminase